MRCKLATILAFLCGLFALSDSAQATLRPSAHSLSFTLTPSPENPHPSLLTGKTVETLNSNGQSVFTECPET